MGLGSPRGGGDSTHPGEPGIGPDLGPPFTAPDEATRWLFSLNRFGIRPGLTRVQGLLADLGHPENELRTLVTAGTNGKGSTTRILATLLQAAGHRVATYTSPHLLNVHERILIDDRAVERAEFSRRVEQIRPLTQKHEASWFETLTALAVSIARDEGVDYFCCETGLGGRLDASNALPAIGTLLTTVGLDHERILGETRQEILAEKLGLLKRDVPLFCGVDEDLRPLVFHAAVTAGSPCHYLDELTAWDVNDDGTWDLKLPDRELRGLPHPGPPAMRRNVALALLTLARLEASRGEILLPDDIAGALGNLFLPGRYQTVLCDPDWIFDTAHNEQALLSTLEEFTSAETKGGRVLVFGAMYDKTTPADLGRLVRRCDQVIGVPVSLPRSRTVEELTALFAEWGVAAGAWPPAPGCHAVAPDLATGLEWLNNELHAEDRVLVTGSCFTVAEALYGLGFTDLEMTRPPAVGRAPKERP